MTNDFEPAAPGQDPAAPTADRPLVAALAAGDRARFRELYDRHVPVVFRYSLSILRSFDDAEDAVQDTWVALWSQRTSIRLHGDSLLPWLLVTCRHKSLKILNKRGIQKRQRSSAAFTVANSNDPADVLLERELAQSLRSAIATLAEVEQRIVALCLDEGYSYERAASEIHMSHGALRSRLSRARAKIRDDLGRDGLRNEL